MSPAGRIKTTDTDPYFYPRTTVLRNHLDIRDQAQLDAAEQRIVSLVIGNVFTDLLHPPHDLPSLLTIHRTLFGRLYPFAGQLRQNTGTMAKVRASGYRVSYGDSAFVPEQIALVFRRLAAEDALVGLDPQAFAARAAHFYGELDAVHPFREGNSRTLRLFFSSLAHTAGYRLNWGLLANLPEGRDRLYAARDRAVMHADATLLAGLFAHILTAL